MKYNSEIESTSLQMARHGLDITTELLVANRLITNSSRDITQSTIGVSIYEYVINYPYNINMLS